MCTKYRWKSRGRNLLRRILHLKDSRHPLARSRRTATCRLDTKDFLQSTSRPVPRQQPQPRDSSLALLALGCISGGGRAGVLGTRGGSQGAVILVEVEEWRCGVGEVVHAADGQVAGRHGRNGLGLREVELHGDLGEHVEQVGVGGGHAGGVE